MLTPEEESRLRRLEGQISSLLEDTRIGSTPLGPLPVADSYMSFRTKNSDYLYYISGAVGGFALPSTVMALTVNKLYASPIYVGKSIRCSSLGFFSGAVNGNVRIGIYDSDRDLYPRNLIKDVGVQAIANPNRMYVIVFSKLRLGGGIHWLTIVSDTNNLTVCKVPAEAVWNLLGTYYVTETVYTDYVVGWEGSHTYGALPNKFPSGATLKQDVPAMAIRFTR